MSVKHVSPYKAFSNPQIYVSPSSSSASDERYAVVQFDQMSTSTEGSLATFCPLNPKVFLCHELVTLFH